MVKKIHKPENDNGGDDGAGKASRSSAQLAGTVRESASQIWLAGLGAFSKAQEEGGKVFETLVKEGMAIQRKTQAAAEEKLTEATSRMASMATDLSSKASGQWDKLESIFEERVSRALKKLGVPAARDVDALVARIDALERQLGAAPKARAAKSAKTAGGTAATRPAARKRTPRKPA